MKTHLLFPGLFIFTAVTMFAAETDHGFAVHEWGTFTSVQGADGVQMVWNPLVAPELPKFVYDRAHPHNGKSLGITVAGKTGMGTLQRMETPVIYFYSDRPRTLDVAVKFPEGTVTEWYPQESALNWNIFSGLKGDKPVLHWPRVEILPKADAMNTALPADSSGSHYYAARETDASVLRVADGTKSEVEKFLFYRGVAGFQAPLTVTLGSSDPKQVSLSNTGSEDLQNLFLYEVRADGSVSWLAVDKLSAGGTNTVDFGSATGAGAETLAAALRRELVRQGLFEKEAAAMVKTWESSWFSERGMRVLYTLPRAWTDRTLPLAINPAPKSTERVMVARAEIITPAMERALLDEVNRYIAAPAQDRPQIVAETRALGMGRFTEAALRRLLVGTERSREFSSLSWELLQAATRPEAKTAATN